MPRVVRSRCVICYDVAVDRNRTKLAKLLLDYGDRMQDSVFEADLTEADITTLLRKCVEFVQQTDSLIVYRLCANCADGVRVIGRRLDISAGPVEII